MLEMLGIVIDSRLGNFPILERLRLHAERLLAAWIWKSHLDPAFPLIVCLVGGTGTGKSTLFNSLAMSPISDVGRKRPCTLRPKILAHEDVVPELKSCPFFRTMTEAMRSTGCTDEVIVAHRDPESAGVILVDTPDFDSVERDHRRMSEDFFLISDVIIFVTSQEKYADQAGHQVSQQALEWGKRTLFVMNKSSSDAAYEDFETKLRALGHAAEPIRVDRVDSFPLSIPGLRERSAFAVLFTPRRHVDQDTLQARELANLKERTAAALEELENALQGEVRRIATISRRINLLVSDITQEMDTRLDAILSQDAEARVRDRLQELLRKYDILFVPRRMVREAFKKLFDTIVDIVTNGVRSGREDAERAMRSEDLHAARAAVRLEPVEAAVAKLNLKIAELLCSDAAWDDLCKIVGSEVPRWDRQQIAALYDDAFPGVEQLLEDEFQRIREGLSTSDEVKLYGSYTLWALLLITVEVVVGGGLTLLDAVLGTVIVPFIPKWVLDLKIIDMLRDIGKRVDGQHRKALRGIVEQQAKQYITVFSGLVPDEAGIRHLRKVRQDTGVAARAR